ncbi:2-polyprenyl-6-methoxyphenol hydroxylase [Amycolatopsis acidicola]|uniref:2-polyprenyl-6-methoxyphenol hydroxylase n=1 Tax=Amycolatopsis acidicola TaxID=2596893 RepID=A0A5N0ULS9_9PSEU|nr:FAD-dependent monooxygenase [Amycolatopsis acidicola]KAA9149571.1 2-polyprenyl-6-methoxyphenol hydroxylase [Amycolatopsis acidicola]
MIRTPVLIAGAGPSGLAVAIELGRAGIPCCLVEPRTTVTTDRPRAKTTSARTMELLRRWGLADQVRAAAPLPVSYSQDVVFCSRVTGHEITRFSHAFGMYDGRRDELAECGQQIPQPVVEAVLREAVRELPSVTFLTGQRLLSAKDGTGGVRAELSDDVVEAGYLIGCDGAAGLTRDAIGARYEGSSGALPNLNITFTAPGLTEDLLCARAIHYWVLGADVGGIVGPMDLDGTWWAIAQGVREGDPVALVRALLGRDLDVEVRATDPWSARMMLADSYRGERIFLVGDAAHLNPPWGGHGYNTSVGDAVNLGWKLAAVLQGWGGPALLDSYEPERRPVAEQTIAAASAQESRLARAFARADLDTDPAARAEAAKALRAKEGEFHSLGLVLGYHYAASPLVTDDGSPVPEHDLLRYHGSGRPGMRLPHRWLPDGSSLYDHLGPGFTLLGNGNSAPLEREAARLGIPFTVLPTGGESVLVRPDQHIAWRGTTPDPAVLRRAAGHFA